MGLSPSSSSGGATAKTAYDDLVSAGIGIFSQVCDLFTLGGNITPGSQVVRGTAIGLRNGDVVTNVILYVGVAAAGAAPALQKVALLDSGGNVVAKSNDLSASAIWTALGFAVAPLSAAYNVSADGLYYACYLRNGNYGTTNPAFLANSSPGFNINAMAGKPLRFGQLAAQADFGASVALAATSQGAWFGVS